MVTSEEFWDFCENIIRAVGSGTLENDIPSALHADADDCRFAIGLLVKKGILSRKDNNLSCSPELYVGILFSK